MVEAYQCWRPNPPHLFTLVLLLCFHILSISVQVMVEAYQRGRLIAVLPFMQKLLECCKVCGGWGTWSDPV